MVIIEYFFSFGKVVECLWESDFVGACLIVGGTSEVIILVFTREYF
jgi:hypothetical protein